MIKELPTAEELHSLLIYDFATGCLTWRQRNESQFGGNAAKCKAWNNAHAGKPALNFINSDGYRVGNISRLGGVKAHRVIWKMFFGSDPNCIDHINGCRSDNRLVNIRAVTSEENAKNIGVSRNNTSGFNGVYWYPRYGKWMASIRIAGRRKNLGYFSEKSDAVAARRDADESAGYSNWRGR